MTGNTEAAPGPDHPNADLVRTLYQALQSGDISTILTVHASDFVAHVGGSSPVAGDWSGAELAALSARLRDETDGTQRSALRHVVATNDFAAVIHRWTATRKGRTIDQHTLVVYRIQDGALAERWEFVENQQAHDDFWSD